MIRDEDLLAQLRLAIDHLDDPLYLETLPLAGKLPVTPQTRGLSRGQALRRALRLAIVALDPAGDAMPAQFTTRSYQVLYRFAISRQSMVAIAHHLGISSRQGYRDLRLATSALAQVIKDLLADSSLGAAVDPEGHAHREEEVRHELERLVEATAQDRVAFADLVRDVMGKASHLAQRKGLDLQLQLEIGEQKITINKVMLGQALLNLLSHVITAHEGTQLVVRVYFDGERVCILCAYECCTSPEPLDPQGPYAVAQQLFHTLGISSKATTEGHTYQIMVKLPLAQERQILVVDDNRGIIALFTSYLRQLPYHVYGAASAAEALEVLQRSRPDIVILDVMMPDRDGWEVLEKLRTRRSVDRPYIIVCSIINDPELAIALGADAFLSKPVSPGQLLQAIEVAGGRGALSAAR